MNTMLPFAHVTPQPSMADRKCTIDVKNLPPSTMVTFHACTFAGTIAFESIACYLTDTDGHVNLHEHASLGGFYYGVDPMGLFWSVEPTLTNTVKHPRFVKKDVTEPQVFHIEVLAGHMDSVTKLHSMDPVERNLLLEFDVVRLYMAPGTKRITVKEKDFKGTLFVPPGNGRFPGVINMLGAMANPWEAKASLLSSYGFAVLNLVYFGLANFKFHVTMEKFESAIQYLQQHGSVEGKLGISIVGLCKGAEIALSMAGCLPGIAGVIAINGAIMPAHNSHQYGDKVWPAPEASGMDLASIGQLESFVLRPIFPTAFDLNIPDAKNDIFPFYKRRDISFMYIAGLEDGNLPSEHYANQAEKLFQYSRHPDYTIVRYPGAGHLLDPPCTPFCVRSKASGIDMTIEFGGAKAAHCRAQFDCWEKSLAFLRRTANRFTWKKGKL